LGGTEGDSWGVGPSDKRKSIPSRFRYSERGGMQEGFQEGGVEVGQNKERLREYLRGRDDNGDTAIDGKNSMATKVTGGQLNYGAREKGKDMIGDVRGSETRDVP